jgi:hypothetical protein
MFIYSAESFSLARVESPMAFEQPFIKTRDPTDPS